MEINHLSRGNHSRREDGMCIAEAAAMLAGEPHSDAPGCVSVTIRGFAMHWNDAMGDEDRDRWLLPRVETIVGTGPAPDEQERELGLMALDWLLRVSTPAWLDLAGLNEHAERLREMPSVTEENAAGFAPVVRAARAAARDAAWASAWASAGAAAWAAAWAAARASAGAAAWDAAWAAAGAAAWAAAWDAAGAAAWDAAGAAAWDAARDAARDAAWDAARDALRPTVELMQASAADLLDRMCARAKEMRVEEQQKARE